MACWLAGIKPAMTIAAGRAMPPQIVILGLVPRTQVAACSFDWSIDVPHLEERVHGGLVGRHKAGHDKRSEQHPR